MREVDASLQNETTPQAYASGAELFYKITFDSARNLKLSLADTVKLLFAQGALSVPWHDRDLLLRCAV
jgi:hypothetical protein